METEERPRLGAPCLPCSRVSGLATNGIVCVQSTPPFLNVLIWNERRSMINGRGVTLMKTSVVPCRDRYRVGQERLPETTSGAGAPITYVYMSVHKCT